MWKFGKLIEGRSNVWPDSIGITQGDFRAFMLRGFIWTSNTVLLVDWRTLRKSLKTFKRTNQNQPDVPRMHNTLKAQTHDAIFRAPSPKLHVAPCDHPCDAASDVAGNFAKRRREFYFCDFAREEPLGVNYGWSQHSWWRDNVTTIMMAWQQGCIKPLMS